MAYFDKLELIDVIRHEVRLEDESGYSASIVPHPRRRAKYGGLPLHFRSSIDDDDDDYTDEGHYEIPLYEEPIGTKEIIEDRMRSRTVESDKVHSNSVVSRTFAEDRDLFVKVDLPTEDSLACNEMSSISKFVAENLTALRNPLNEYAQYEAVGDQDSKKIHILFPADEDGHVVQSEVSVQPTAKVSQVIGHCCYKYLQITSKELPGCVGEYDLFMAEEDGDIDLDFPPLERTRAIGDLGFPVLAIVRAVKQGNEENSTVTVYFTSGEHYEISVPDTELTVAWLCDQALAKRIEHKKTVEGIDLPYAEYTIERLDKLDEVFKPDAPIRATFCTEFVMVRKNSSRGDFIPRPQSGLFSQMSVCAPTSPTPTQRHSAVFDFTPLVRDDPMTSLSVGNVDENGFISCFVVERLHKYKPRWTANLILRWNKLELTPFASEQERRRSFLPQKYQKETMVPWEHVCEVIATVKEREKETVHILTIYWLPIHRSMFRTGSPEEEEISLPFIIQSCEYVQWKSVSVECKSLEDVVEITSIIRSILQSRESPVYQAWQCSDNGCIRPVAAADSALRSLQTTDSAPEPPFSKKRGRLRSIARLGRLFAIREK